MSVMKYTLLSAVLPSKTTHLGVFYYQHDHPLGIVINSVSLVIRGLVFHDYTTATYLTAFYPEPPK